MVNGPCGSEIYRKKKISDFCQMMTVGERLG